MENCENILKLYFEQIEAGKIPSFDCLIQRYMSLIAYDPKCYEVYCLTALLVTLCPVDFEKAIKAKLQELCFPELRPAPQNSIQLLKDPNLT